MEIDLYSVYYEVDEKYTGTGIVQRCTTLVNRKDDYTLQTVIEEPLNKFKCHLGSVNARSIVEKFKQSVTAGVYHLYSGEDVVGKLYIRKHGLKIEVVF